MSSYIVPYVFVPNTLIQSAQVNSNFSTAASVINGNLDTTNLSATAGIKASQLALTSAFLDLLATSGVLGFGVGQTGDTIPRIGMYSDGSLQFGPGTASATDVGLKRSAANTIQLYVPGGGTPTFDFNSGTIANVVTFSPTNLAITGITAHTVLIGEASSNIVGVGPGTKGRVLTSQGAADPIYSLPVQAVPQLRAYLNTGAPYTDGSSAGNSSIFVGPLPTGNLVTWDDGSGNLTTTALTETTLSLSALAATNSYSLYLYNNSGTWTLEQDVWSGANTPPTYSTDALGRYTKPSSTNKLLVAEFYLTSTGTVFNYTGERSLVNIYNKKNAAVFAQIPVSSWTYTTATLRASDANTTNGQGRAVVFQSSVPSDAAFKFDSSVQTNGAGAQAYNAIGVDSTTVAYNGQSIAFMALQSGMTSSYTVTGSITPPLSTGTHYIQMLELGEASQTWYGNAGGTAGTSQLTGIVQQ